MLCGEPINSCSVKPLISTKTWLAKTMVPPRSVRETSGSPSGTSTSWSVIGSFTRMVRLLPRDGSPRGAQKTGYG